MGLSKVDICNHALLKIGADTISSLDTASNTTEATIQSAKFCNILFDQALEEVLRMHKWNNAMKRAQLTRLTDAPAFKWKYKYLLPSDCVRVVNLYDSTDAYDDQTQWVVEGKNILTDYEKVYLSYVSKPQDVSTLNSFVTQCVIQNLAIKLSVPMQLDEGLQNNLLQEFTIQILPQAKSIDAQENKWWDMEESDTLLSVYKTSPVI
tara:strand:- start:64 stop:684 length:621 start_codon:yes stop_codon:yes gene_type:complete